MPCYPANSQFISGGYLLAAEIYQRDCWPWIYLASFIQKKRIKGAFDWDGGSNSSLIDFVVCIVFVTGVLAECFVLISYQQIYTAVNNLILTGSRPLPSDLQSQGISCQQGRIRWTLPETISLGIMPRSVGDFIVIIFLLDFKTIILRNCCYQTCWIFCGYTCTFEHLSWQGKFIKQNLFNTTPYDALPGDMLSMLLILLKKFVVHSTL